MLYIPELKELGMTKAQFAKYMGLRPETVWNWVELPVYAKRILELLVLTNLTLKLPPEQLRQWVTEQELDTRHNRCHVKMPSN